MSSRLLFGGAAAAAAGYMIYEYQQQNDRQRQALIPAAHPNDGTLKKQSFDQQISGLNKDIKQGKDETKKWVKDQAEYGRSKATEMTNSFQKNLQDEADRQKGSLHDIVDETSSDVSKGWNRIKEGVSDDTQTIKDALLRATPKPGAPSSSSSSLDTSQAKERTKELAQGAKESSKSIFNWGFNEAERAKAIAIGEYDKANKEYNTLLDRYNTSKKGLFDSGDSVLKQQLDDYKKVVQNKKAELEKASKDYSKYTKNNFNDISNKLDEQDEKIRKEGGFFKWLTGSSVPGDEKTEDVDRIANNKSLAGFGENAAFFSQEQIEDQLRNKEIGPSEAQKRLDQLKKIKQEGWFQYHKEPETEEQIAKRAAQGLSGWGETAAQLAQDEYDEAKTQYRKKAISSREEATKAVDDAWAKLQDAKKAVDETGSSWWQFGKEKTNELNEEAQKTYNTAKSDYDSAKETLSIWSDKASGKFWSSADNAVRVTQNAADKVQSAANKARAKTQEKIDDDDYMEQEQLLEE